MTIKQALAKFYKVEIDLLLMAVLKKSGEFIFLHPEYKLSSRQAKSLSSLIKRRQKGEPIAYIVGYKNFFDLRFKVNPNVLIPRPETEWLVERVYSHVIARRYASEDEAISSHDRLLHSPTSHYSLNGAAKNKPIKILDVGTGSGCIIISIAKQLTTYNLQPIISFQFTASDISKAALAVAKANAKAHAVNIKFYNSDLLNAINKKFDIIIANLPYVPKTDLTLRLRDNVELKYEPTQALTDGTNGFEIYEQFFKDVGAHIMRPNDAGVYGPPDRKMVFSTTPVIYLEIDPKARPFVRKWAKKYLPGLQVKFYKDFSGLWRYAAITGNLVL